MKMRYQTNNSQLESLDATNRQQIALVFMLGTGYAQQVTLTSVSSSLGNTLVSTTTTATVRMTRQIGGQFPVWQPNHCFQFFVQSPYGQRGIYQTFSAANPPTCTSKTAGFTVACVLVSGSTDTVSFWFTSITGSPGATVTLVEVTISNFVTPFSAQNLQTLNLRSFSDLTCSTNQRQIQLPALNIQPQTMPANSVSITTSNQTVGDTSFQNSLIVTFTPLTTMSPAQTGSIYINIPNWYSVGQSVAPMYDQRQANKCFSQSFALTSSQLVGNQIQINYNSMTTTALKGVPITVTCRGFYNPIVPTIVSGFSVTTLDGERIQKVIEYSKDISLDASKYSPAIIDISTLSVVPTNTTVNTYSQWNLQISMLEGPPLEQNCYIRLFFPDDFLYKYDTATASDMFLPSNNLQNGDPLPQGNIIVIPKNGSVPMSLVFTGCQNMDSLGATPFGSLQLASLRTQVSLKDSGFFGMNIYKDQAMTQLIATLAPGLFIPMGDIQPGPIVHATITPSITQVQQVTAITFNFTISNQLLGPANLRINLPIFTSPLPLGSNLTVSSKDGSTPATIATVLQGSRSSQSGQMTFILEIQNFVPEGKMAESNKPFSITVEGLINQVSTKDCGLYSISTFVVFGGIPYLVDTAVFPNSYKATGGLISSNGTIAFENPLTFARGGVYTFRFITESKVPPQGFIQLVVPPDLFIVPSTTFSTGSCRQLTCSNVTPQTVSLQLPLGLPQRTPLNLTIGGFQNPRSFAPTGKFIINTLDIDGFSAIDSGYNQNAAMSAPADLQSFSARPSSLVNGQLNNYTFSIQSNLTIANGDKVSFNLPAELIPPENSSLTMCTGVSNVESVVCTIKNRTITAQLLQVSVPSGAYSWTVSNIGNPPDTRTSSSFTNVQISDQNDFLALVLKPTVITVTNQQPAIITNYSIEQGTIELGALTNYKLNFYPVNALPSTGSMQILYPQQIILQDGAFTNCTVTTSAVYSSCSISTDSQTITIDDVFSSTSTYSGQITVALQNIVNPVINRPGNGFIISTYADTELTYIKDKLNDFKMTPQFKCAYPCNLCSATDRTSCETCWLTDANSPHFLMKYTDGKPSSCKSSCDPGSTTNGNKLLNCQSCDPMCGTCFDTGTVGDFQRCLTCSATHPLKVANTTTCLSTCTLGLFQTSPQSCDFCTSPCMGCNGTSDACTSCDPTGLTPFLYENTCLKQCPVGFFSIDGVCSKCASPCATCMGTSTNCTKCDGSNETKFIIDGICYKDCPPNYSPIVSNNSCFECNKDCDLCSTENKDECFICTKPNVSHQGKCVTECPKSWILNEAGLACREWTLADAGILPFPFIAAFIVLSVVVLFGMLSKRGVIVNRKAEMRNVQNTLTCILIILGPIKSLATCAQWLLSYINQTTNFTILSLVVTVINLILNFCFVIWFTKKYIRRVKYVDRVAGKDVVFYDYFDDLLKAYTEKHQKSFCLIQFLSLGHYHFNKLIYSRFYSRDLFEARFEHSKVFRKNLMIFGIFYLIGVDVLMVAIDITGLTQITPNNQLYITMVETLILSLLSIILGGLEIYKMRSILQYTELTKREKLLLYQAELARKAMAGAKSQDKRAEDIEDIIEKVKSNKSKFLNNKLDELLGIFGDRRCLSMVDHQFGEDKEKDQRELLSWPMSPASKSKKFRRMDSIQFTEADVERFLALQDNCYAEIKKYRNRHDFGTQGDAGLLEFQDALNRKHGGLMSQIEGDTEEQRMKKQVRRRGRKNKYYTQIDLEDDLEADQAEGSDRENELQVIKEQEEEDEALRKLVSADAKRSLEAAANRKSKLADDQLLKQNKDQQDAEARRLKELQIAENIRLQAEEEQRLLAEQVRLAQKAKDDQEAQRLREAENKKLQAHEQTMQNAVNRAEYDAQEAARQSAALQAASRKRQEEELKAAHELERQRLSREKELLNAQKLQEQRDQELLREKQKKLEEDQQKRLKEKVDAQKKDTNKSPDGIQDPISQREVTSSRQGIRPVSNEEQRVASRQEKRLDEKEEQIVQKEGQDNDTRSELNQSIQMADQVLSNFKGFQSKIDVPPNAELRTFNENDILGELDRDDKGNVLVLNYQDGTSRDLQGHLTNQRGYLQDGKTGNIVENQSAKVMFTKSEMDSRGEVPAPFCIEKYNFNPHQLFGDFDFDQQEKPIPMQTTKGFLIDKKGRRVNKFGWMTHAGQGHLVDQHGRKKFDRKQLVNDGDLPKLFTYNAKRFDIKDVMGQFEKDQNGFIIPCSSQTGLVDNLSRKVNERGYLIDEQGNIIDVNGKQLWKVTELKSGEFPKIFPFTKFNIQRVQGDFEMNPSGNPILKKRADGKLLDNQGQVVNERGYLIDGFGNVVDRDGNVMFDKIVLEADGEIPQVFRTGLLKSDTASSLSRLMSEIERNHPSEFDGREEGKYDDPTRMKNEGETSVDSQMEDTPANYNLANQRFDERERFPGEPIQEDEEGDEHMAAQSEYEVGDSLIPTLKRRRKKKKAPKLATIELLEPTKREKNLAGAYGGQAKGELRRPGVKYEKERLANSKKFRVSTTDEPKVRAQLQQLVNSNSGLNQLLAVKQGSSQGKDGQPKAAKVQGLMGVTDGFSNDGLSQISKSQRRGKSRVSESRKADSRAMMAPPKGSKGKRGMQDGDFEQMFGKDIDQFLEDSEWDIESLDKVSHNSRDSGRSAANELKLKQMEKLYLKRIGVDPQQPMHTSSVHRGSRDNIHHNNKIGRQANEPSPKRSPNPRKKELKPERETIIEFTDNPGVIHRGEILEFKTKK